MKPSVTPLRYPGGKTWLLDYVKEFLKFHRLEPIALVEPYAGSASISIGLLRVGLVQEAFISEKDPLIVAFWNAVLENNDELIEYVSTLEISMDTWFSSKKYLSYDSAEKYSTIELAGAFLFFNRTNYSGIIKGGPLGGKRQESSYKLDCRFNRKRIMEKIRNLQGLEGRLHVSESDGIDFMEKMAMNGPEEMIFYIDPPYYGAGKNLYRYYFTDKEHEELSAFLTTLELPWLLSYDDAEFIKALYKKKTKFPVYTDYQSGYLKKDVKELLISNYIIPPIAPKTLIESQPQSLSQTCKEGGNLERRNSKNSRIGVF